MELSETVTMTPGEPAAVHPVEGREGTLKSGFVTPLSVGPRKFSRDWWYGLMGSDCGSQGSVLLPVCGASQGS